MDGALQARVLVSLFLDDEQVEYVHGIHVPHEPHPPSTKISTFYLMHCRNQRLDKRQHFVAAVV